VTIAVDPILVADDDDRIAALFSVALSEAGYDVVRAADGVEALEIIAQRPISLVVLDSRMPRLDGSGVIDALRADRQTERLPIIVVTAEAELDDRIRGLDAGADDYVAKPVDIDELVARVRTQLRSQAVWADAVLREIGDRSEVLAAIAKTTTSDEPRVVAATIVEHLLDLSACAYAAILWFPPDGTVVTLAEAEASARDTVGTPTLLAGLAERIRAQAKDGPVTHDLATHSELIVQMSSEIAEIISAPFHHGSADLGAVVLGLERDGHVDRQAARSRLLSAAIDAASVVGAILGPGLIVTERVSIERDRVEKVLARGELYTVYQPLVTLVERAVVGYEALTRFPDGTPPDVRFSQATRVGLGPDLELAAARLAIERARDLPPNVWLAVNVSPEVIIEGARLEELLIGAPCKVVLEITEHAAIDDYHIVRAALDRMRRHANVAIDDAGAGFASLRHILELRPDLVKLDASLVRGIERDPVRQSLVAGLAHFATTAGFGLLGEAIETDAEAASLQKLGVTLGQGYLFGRPEPLPASVVPAVHGG
jgi:EAL domain-containing protein (putative c-di-GMP-specific phosphodiesterase class I)/DNA-binding response OmpR family regulator